MENIYRRYINNECSEEEKSWVIQKLGANVPPAELLQLLHRYWIELEGVRSVEDVDFDGVLNKIHHSINIDESEIKEKRFLRSGKTRRLVGIAASLLLVLLVGTSIWYAGSKGIFLEEDYYTVASVRGQSSKVTLPDGSEVWLNGESSIVYSSRYGAENRDIKLNGEGFFRVAKSFDNPFVVDVNGVEVRALGTAFNIDAYGDNDIVKVTLESGIVQITGEGEEVKLGSGMQALVYADRIDVKKVDVELYTSWHKGLIVFKNEQLKTITDQLEKLYDVAFEYKTDSLKEFRYRGTIRLDHSILKALEVLKVSTGIEYKIEGNKVILDKVKL